MGQRQKEDLNIPTMIFCIIGVVLSVFGFLLLKNDNFKLNIISTEGTVSGVQTKTTADGKYINEITFNLPKESSKNVKFYKVDKSKDYTYPNAAGESAITVNY